MRALPILLLVTLTAALHAEEFAHPDFKFTVPDGFVRGASEDAEPSAYCVYYRKGSKSPYNDTHLIVEPMSSDVPDRIESPEKIMVFRFGMRSGERMIWDWNETKIGVLEGYLDAGTSTGPRGETMTNYRQIIIAYLPVRPTSVRVTVIGNTADQDAMRGILRSTLASLKPAKEEGFFDSGDSGGTYVGMTVVFGAMALVLIGGVTFLVLRSRGRTPGARGQYAPPPQQYPPQQFDQPPPDPSPPRGGSVERAPWED
ncbi:MAG: hypothetical protein K8I27_11155 [Planctomycetes bacterium]|nr:hypothetical protein [Planctomycetota bacterium]